MRCRAALKAVVLSLLLWILWAAAVPEPRAVEGHSAAQVRFKDDPFSAQGSSARLIASDPIGVLLEFRAPAFQTEQVERDGRVCDRIEVPGFGESSMPGWPRLPVDGVMIGVPEDVELEVIPVTVDSRRLVGHYDICPGPASRVGGGLFGLDLPPAAEIARDSLDYTADAVYPEVPVEIVRTGKIRSQRVVQLRFSPFQYHPDSGKLRFVRRIRVKIRFTGGTRAQQDAPVSIDEGAFEDVLAASLVNYETARPWRASTGPAEPGSGSVNVASAGASAYRIKVEAEGIYQLTYAELASVGFPVDRVDPNRCQLSNRGRVVAMEVVDGGDGSFDSKDHVLFYGERIDSRYTDVNVYWLTCDAASPPRMGVRSGAVSDLGRGADAYTTTFRWQEDTRYLTRAPEGGDGDHWYADYVFAYGSRAATAYAFDLRTFVSDAAYSMTVRGRLYGYTSFDTSPDHHTRVYLNGHLIDDARWDGERHYGFERTVPQSYLVQGTNVISVACPFDLPSAVDFDLVYPDWFEFDYVRGYRAEDDRLFFEGDDPGRWIFEVGGFTTETLELFDVTTPTSPVRILDHPVELDGSTYGLRFEDEMASEHRYLALTRDRRMRPFAVERDRPSGLRSPNNGADYLMITHRDFYTDLLPLATHYERQGLRTRVVDVQDIYDEFNDGILHPEAIRDFLRYAYTTWSEPAATYVLLVGDGHFDFLDNRGWEARSYIPPYLADADPWLGEVPADNRYVCVSGDDRFPDMHLGRLPVNSPAETRVVVEKILAYTAQGSQFEGWQERILFVADDADPAGDFPAHADAIADNDVPAAYSVDKIYYGNHQTTRETTRDAIVHAINDGRLIVNYIGHSGVEDWAHEGLFRSEEMDRLTNADCLPLMVPMTCLDGYYVRPQPPGGDNSSVAERMVRMADGGAVASWSPTGFGVAAGHGHIHHGLYDAFFRKSVTRLGPATTLAKLHLIAGGDDNQELLDTYLLFGDPAMSLNAAHIPGRTIYLPLVMR